MLFDRLVRLLRPRQNGFFTLLEGIASRIEVAAAAFGGLADAADVEQIQAIAVRLKAIETDAEASAGNCTRRSTARSSRRSTGKIWSPLPRLSTT